MRQVGVIVGCLLLLLALPVFRAFCPIFRRQQRERRRRGDLASSSFVGRRHIHVGVVPVVVLNMRKETEIGSSSASGGSGGKDVREADEEEVLGPLEAAAAETADDDDSAAAAAATGTVNERLLAELEKATDKEKYGARSGMGEKLGLSAFRSDKTDEEREAAIRQARDLNGVNPVVALTGAAFTLAVAVGLFALTNYLAEFFALHPVEADAPYIVQRVTAVFRNVVMGLVSLASGFFGVTGVGIFLLGARVAVGVARGELDPTPLKKSKVSDKPDEVDLKNIWDLMTNKKPSSRRKK